MRTSRLQYQALSHEFASLEAERSSVQELNGGEGVSAASVLPAAYDLACGCFAAMSNSQVRRRMLLPAPHMKCDPPQGHLSQGMLPLAMVPSSPLCLPTPYQACTCFRLAAAVCCLMEGGPDQRRE